MKYLKEYRYYKINEEFVGSLVKGALSGIFKAFSSQFKNLTNDIKKIFKDDDPSSVKGIITSNLNKGIDNAQKLIRDNNIRSTGDIVNIMSQFISTITELANNINKDFSLGIKDKKEANAATEIAKSILLGNKEAEWTGIIGLLSDPKYKFSKAKYEQAITTASSKESGQKAIKIAQDTAFKFFDAFQKDMTQQIDKEITEDEIKKIYDEAIKKGGGENKDEMDYKKLKDYYDRKIPVIYKRDGYDDNKTPEEQVNAVATKLINALDDQGNVTFKTDDGLETFKKKYSDILGAKNDDIAKEVTKELTKIRDDKDKLSLVKNFTQFLQSDNKEKISAVEDIINQNVKQETK